MSDISTSIEKLAEGLASHFKDFITFAGNEKGRLDGALGDLESLKTTIETDVLAKLGSLEDTIKSSVIDAVTAKFQPIVDELGTQIAALTGGSLAAAPTGSASSSTAPTTPVISTLPDGSTVSVGADSTTHVDPTESTTTVLDHATGTATATDETGAAITPDPTAVQAAQGAAAAAGVTVGQ